jgi:hypothetical protein
MLDALKLRVAAAVVKDLVRSLATDKNTQTTVVGAIAGVLLAIKDLDWAKLLAGDPQQIAMVASGIAVWGIGYLATKENHDGHTTLLGVLAAAAQAYVGNFTAAATIGLCGYFTNKAVPARTAEEGK